MDNLKNVGRPDQMVRYILGAILLLAAFFAELSSTTSVVLGVLGVVSIATAITNICPAYLLLRISTLKKG